MTHTRSLVAAEGNQVSSSKTRRGSRRRGMPLEPVIVAPVAHEPVAVASAFKISICKKDFHSFSLSLGPGPVFTTVWGDFHACLWQPVANCFRSLPEQSLSFRKFDENSLQNMT